jgi:hypothetical protein
MKIKIRELKELIKEVNQDSSETDQPSANAKRRETAFRKMLYNYGFEPDRNGDMVLKASTSPVRGVELMRVNSYYIDDGDWVVGITGPGNILGQGNPSLRVESTSKSAFKRVKDSIFHYGDVLQRLADELK